MRAAVWSSSASSSASLSSAAEITSSSSSSDSTTGSGFLVLGAAFLAAAFLAAAFLRVGAASVSSFLDFLLAGFFSASLSALAGAAGASASSSVRKSAARLRGLTSRVGWALAFGEAAVLSALGFAAFFFEIDLGTVSLVASAAVASTFLVFLAGESAATGAAVTALARPKRIPRGN
jgi:hypothetical protein